MAGLVPAIHAAPLRQTFQEDADGAAWMAGNKPGHDGVVKSELLTFLPES
jgi:hypothetical protein